MLTSGVPDTPYEGVKCFVETAIWNVDEAHDAIIASCVHQTHHANKHQCEGPNISVSSRVYLSTKNLLLLLGHACKLVPCFIGPYEVLSHDKACSNYTLKLPLELEKCMIHLTFHVKLL